MAVLLTRYGMTPADYRATGWRTMTNIINEINNMGREAAGTNKVTIRGM